VSAELSGMRRCLECDAVWNATLSGMRRCLECDAVWNATYHHAANVQPPWLHGLVETGHYRDLDGASHGSG
jgi:hypothetical protein